MPPCRAALRCAATTTTAAMEMEEEGEKSAVMDVSPPPPPPVVVGETNWIDLSAKIRALMGFAAAVGASGGGVDRANRYDDKIYAFVEGHSEKPEKPIDLMWTSPGLDSWEKLMLPPVCQADSRPHEVLLRNHLSEYSLVIRKQPGYWSCRVTTPPSSSAAPGDPSSSLLLSNRRVVCMPLTPV
jgi:hypothetical protein